MRRNRRRFEAHIHQFSIFTELGEKREARSETAERLGVTVTSTNGCVIPPFNLHPNQGSKRPLSAAW